MEGFKMEGLKQENNVEDKEDFSTKIELYFFRHDDKGNADGRTDQEVQISEKGRKHAASFSTDDQIEQSVVFGSPRIRTKETAILHMAGKMFTEEEFQEGNYAFEKLIEKIGMNKIATDKRLDFFTGNNNKFNEDVKLAFSQGSYLKFLVERSDEFAKEIGDNNVGSYSRVAAGIAEIVKKYVAIAPKFEKLVSEKPEEYGNVMKRFMGTHQTPSECFLAKVVEKIDGIESRDEFVRALNNQGFDLSEGFECDVITNKDGKIFLHIKFEKPATEEKGGFVFDKNINPSILDEIISDLEN